MVVGLNPTDAASLESERALLGEHRLVGDELVAKGVGRVRGDLLCDLVQGVARRDAHDVGRAREDGLQFRERGSLGHAVGAGDDRRRTEERQVDAKGESRTDDALVLHVARDCSERVAVVHGDERFAARAAQRIGLEHEPDHHHEYDDDAKRDHSAQGLKEHEGHRDSFAA